MISGTISWLKAQFDLVNCFDSHNCSTVELGDKELFGHPKIVP